MKNMHIYVTFLLSNNQKLKHNFVSNKNNIVKLRNVRKSSLYSTIAQVWILQRNFPDFAFLPIEFVEL